MAGEEYDDDDDDDNYKHKMYIKTHDDADEITDNDVMPVVMMMRMMI